MRISCPVLVAAFTRWAAALLVGLAASTPCSAAFSLDPSFGSGGKVAMLVPSSASGNSRGLRLYVQPGGRIVAAGAFTRSTSDGQMSGVTVVGLQLGGAIDSSFAIYEGWQSNGFTSLNDVHFYADGRVLGLSRFTNTVGSSTLRPFRLGVNGTIDAEFASNAVIGPVTGFGTYRASQIAACADGKVIALVIDSGQYQLHRFNPNGTADTGFGNNGVVVLNFNRIPVPAETEIHMIPLANGGIQLVGNVREPATPSVFTEYFLGRLTERGGWDKTFHRQGFFRVAFGDGLSGRVRAAVIQPDGKILIAGHVAGPDDDVWLTRFQSNGKRDANFGNGGTVVRDFVPGGLDTVSAVALSGDGKIRAVGSSGSPASFLVARFGSNGAFEEDIAVSFTPGQYANAADVALQSDGKIVVLGETRNANVSIPGGVFAFARLTE